jgi:hypothetical protein
MRANHQPEIGRQNPAGGVQIEPGKPKMDLCSGKSAAKRSGEQDCKIGPAGVVRTNLYEKPKPI